MSGRLITLGRSLAHHRLPLAVFREAGFWRVAILSRVGGTAATIAPAAPAAPTPAPAPAALLVLPPFF
jgi:hypothetical protein